MQSHLDTTEEVLSDLPEPQQGAVRAIFLSFPEGIPTPAFLDLERTRIVYPMTKGKPEDVAFVWGRDIAWSAVDLVVTLDGRILTGGEEVAWSTDVAVSVFAPAATEDEVRGLDPRTAALLRLKEAAQALDPADAAALAIDPAKVDTCLADAVLAKQAILSLSR